MGEYIKQNDQIIIGIERLISKSEEVKTERAEKLAKVFDNYDTAIADRIRDKGLPVVAICGKEIYKTIMELMGGYFKVREMPFCDDNLLVFSWEKEPNLSRPLSLNHKLSVMTNSKEEDEIDDIEF